MSAPPTLVKRLYPLWFMLAVTILFMSAVTGAHLGTKELVDRNQSLYLKRAVLDAAGLPVPEENDQAEALYQEKVKPAEAPDSFEAQTDKGPVNVTKRAGIGLWGEIIAMVGVDAKGSLTGVSFTSQNETPGLGARIEEHWFRDQFRGKQPPVSLKPEGTRSDKPNEVDAITGASVTSKAVRDIVNREAGHGR